MMAIMVTAWLSSYMCECVSEQKRGFCHRQTSCRCRSWNWSWELNKVYLLFSVSCEFDENFSVFCLSSFVLGEAVLNVPKRHGRPPFWKIPSRICETLVERRGVRLFYSTSKTKSQQQPTSTSTFECVRFSVLYCNFAWCGLWSSLFLFVCRILYVSVVHGVVVVVVNFCVYERQIVGSLCCLSAVCLVREHDDKARKRKSNRFETFSQYCKVLVEQFHVFIHGMLQFLSCTLWMYGSWISLERMAW